MDDPIRVRCQKCGTTYDYSYCVDRALEACAKCSRVKMPHGVKVTPIFELWEPCDVCDHTEGTCYIETRHGDAWLVCIYDLHMLGQYDGEKVG